MGRIISTPVSILIILAVVLIGGIFVYKSYYLSPKAEPQEQPEKLVTSGEEGEEKKFISNSDAVARDARLEANMNQLRSLAETYAIKKEGYVYTGFSCTSDSNTAALCQAIKEEIGIQPTIHVLENDYCAYVRLSSGEKYFCFDKKGEAKETKIYPGDPGYCTETTFKCSQAACDHYPHDPGNTKVINNYIRNDMSQLRTVAALYESNSGGYTGFSCDASERMIALCSCFQESEILEPTVRSSKSAFCAYTKLVGEDKYICVDSTLRMSETSINPAASGYCAGVTFVCP